MVLGKQEKGEWLSWSDTGLALPTAHWPGPTYCWGRGGRRPPAGWMSLRGWSTRRGRRGSRRSLRSGSLG